MITKTICRAACAAWSLSPVRADPQHRIETHGPGGGDHNVGIDKRQGAPDPGQELRELADLVGMLRGQVGPGDRGVIDGALDAIDSGDTSENGPLRGALRQVAGIAVMVGEVGAPVIEAIRKVMTALGWG